MKAIIEVSPVWQLDFIIAVSLVFVICDDLLQTKEGDKEIATKMQELALSEGALPRHLHTSLFTISSDQRMLTNRSKRNAVYAWIFFFLFFYICFSCCCIKIKVLKDVRIIYFIYLF